jgi:transcriptional regulator of heat shock response
MSLVSVAYQGTNCRGEIHILGPTRMPYERNIGLVEFTAARIENLIKMRQTK